MSTEAKQEVDHARENAAGWLESIREMVANTTREGAAELFVQEWSREQCIESLDKALDDTGDYSHESVEELRATLVEGLTNELYEIDGFEFDEDAARQTIEESVLSVEVRSDWYSIGADDDARKPAEFNILLSTGGPALRLLGELDEHGQPTRAWLEYRDWGTPWTHYYVEGAGEVLLTFARVFYFGE